MWSISAKFWALVFFLLVHNGCPYPETELKVSVYYEALCPDSIEFVVEQFYPAFKLIGQYLNVELIPFGFATASNQTGKWVFNCQHGPRECYSNKVQSCAIAINHESDSVEYVNCIEKADQSLDNIFNECAKKRNIKYEPIAKCVNSSMADELLLKNGEKTKAVIPPIQFIPTIVFNDSYNDTNQKSALRDFLRTACSLMNDKPKECIETENELLRYYLMN